MTNPTPLSVWQQHIKPYIQPMRALLEEIAAPNVSGGEYMITAGEEKSYNPHESRVDIIFRWSASTKDQFRFWSYGDTYETRQQDLFTLRLSYEPERPNGFGDFSGTGWFALPCTGSVEADVQRCREAFQKAFADGTVGSVYSKGFTMSNLDKLLRRYPKSPWYMKLPTGDRWLGSEKLK